MQYGLVRARVVNSRAAGITPPGELRSILIARQDIPFLVRWSFLLFAFTLPFQFADLPFTSGTFSLSKISGLLFFAMYFLYYNPLSRNRSFPQPPVAIWCFLAYVAVYALNGFFVPEEFLSEFRTGLFTLVQLLVLFWCASELFKEEKMARSFFLTYSIAAGMFALGVILNLPGFSVSEVADRVTAFETNPNSVARIMAIAAVALIGLYLNTVSKHLLTKLLLLLLMLIIVVVMVKTGSRGGVLGFILGSVTYSMPFLKLQKKWIPVFLVSLCTTAVVYMIVSNPVFLERVQQSYEGNLAARELIFPIAIEMILEQPLVGWRPVELWYEISSRAAWREFSDAHNLFLHLLMEVGIVGAGPFFLGLWLCGRAAWQARSGHLSLMPLALLLTLLAVNLSGTGTYEKSLWLVLALGFAAEHAVARRHEKTLGYWYLKDGSGRVSHETVGGS